VMADYSPHVLSRARERVAGFADRVASIESLELDFRNPMMGLSHLRGKVLFAHTCNLYDNLPTDELMRVGGRAYEPLVRASITPGEVADLSARHGIAEDEIVAVVQKVLREGPESFGDLTAGVRFWADVWDAVHLEEIYAEIAAPAAMRVAPSSSPCSAMRLRSRAVIWRIGSTPSSTRSADAASADTFTVAAWLSVTLTASTVPASARAAARMAAASGSRGGPNSAVTTKRPAAMASASEDITPPRRAGAPAPRADPCTRRAGGR
jgi:hypothetical protein